MALTNGQYEKIQRVYSRRIVEDREDQQVRIREAFEQIPELKLLEEGLADLSMSRARVMLGGDYEAAEKLASELAELKERKKLLLAEAGLPSDQLEMRYQCPICKDTGVVDGQNCSCKKKLIIELLYDQSAIRQVLMRENFNTFSFDYFDKTVKDGGIGLSAYDTMKRNVDICRDFVQNFSTAGGNLLLMGQAGTGKTFLSNCVAKELIDQYYSVIYLSSAQLFEALAREAFRRSEEGDLVESEKYILECDLLIIDDLGTEVNNSFVGSRLFGCINERILRRKSTIISTNLGLNDIRRLYTDRVASRIMGSYQILQFPEQDIRVKKRWMANKEN